MKHIIDAISELQSMLEDHGERSASIHITSTHCAMKYMDSVVVMSAKGENVVSTLSRNRKPPNASVVREIYDAYPRKRDRHAAAKAIIKALRDNEIPGPANKRHEFLLNAVRMYAASVKMKGVEQKMIPYPTTWFNRGSYLNSIEEQTKPKGQQW